MKRLTSRQQFYIGGMAGAAAFSYLITVGVMSEKAENEAKSSPTQSISPSQSPSPSKTPSKKASPTPSKTVKPTPLRVEQYDGDIFPTEYPPKLPSKGPGGLTELVDRLKYNEENNEGYDRAKFGSRVPTAATREALIEAEMRPNNTWYSWWDGHVYEGADGLDADHTVALAEAWGSGARDWTEKKRIDFANDLSSPYTLNLITDILNVYKSDKDPFDWMPAVNRCEYVKQWTSVKLRWNLTVDAEEKMALHFRAEECDKA